MPFALRDQTMSGLHQDLAGFPTAPLVRKQKASGPVWAWTPFVFHHAILERPRLTLAGTAAGRPGPPPEYRP